MDLTLNLFIKIFSAILVSLGFAVLFNTPRRAMWVVALLGGIGFGIKTILMEALPSNQVIFASLAGATAVGILGIYFAHRVHTPPIVFTAPAVINMIPGKFGYEFIIGLIEIVSFNQQLENSAYIIDVMNNGLKTGFILMALAFGVIFPILIFNTKTVKNRDLNKVISEKVLRRIKLINKHKKFNG